MVLFLVVLDKVVVVLELVLLLLVHLVVDLADHLIEVVQVDHQHLVRLTVGDQCGHDNPFLVDSITLPRLHCNQVDQFGDSRRLGN